MIIHIFVFSFSSELCEIKDGKGFEGVYSKKLALLLFEYRVVGIEFEGRGGLGLGLGLGL